MLLRAAGGTNLATKVVVQTLVVAEPMLLRVPAWLGFSLGTTALLPRPGVAVMATLTLMSVSVLGSLAVPHSRFLLVCCLALRKPMPRRML